MEPIVSLEDVTFAYQDANVLQNVTFSIDSGEFIGIIGPNGGGKTTLLKLIMGFLRPLSGKVLLFGSPPGKSIFQQIAYVPQNLRFDREFPISVLELVLMGRLSHLPWYGIYGKDQQKAALDALEKVGLLDLRNEAFGTLSGGQIQRALIARAIASKPKLLLLDEPTANVDSQAEAGIYAILKGLQGSMTILMVTHDLRAAVEHVQRVLCVQKSVFSLKPEEVCQHFAIGLYHPPLVKMSPSVNKGEGR